MTYQPHSRQEQLDEFSRLLDVLDELREKCPWDRKQTNQSLRPNTIEETYELCDALQREDNHDICKELGDVLLHVCFYAKIGSEHSAFDMADVCRQLREKLVYRHPHIYPPKGSDTATQATTAEAVLREWERLKTHEKDGNRTVLSGVPRALPSLIKAYRIQDKARGVGFDWQQRQDVWEKVWEEVREFQQELSAASGKGSAAAEEELGDLLFSIINAARLYKLNPDNALESTNQKFIRRFTYIEQQATASGRELSDLTLEQMEALWQEAKHRE